MTLNPNDPEVREVVYSIEVNPVAPDAWRAVVSIEVNGKTIEAWGSTPRQATMRAQLKLWKTFDDIGAVVESLPADQVDPDWRDAWPGFEGDGETP